MTESDKQRTIAGWMGWTCRDGEMEYDGANIKFTIWTKDGKDYNSCDVPRFTTDLNANT